MKELVMIYGDDLRHVQGANYMIDHFVKGKNYLNDIILTEIYGAQTINVAGGEQMPIGVNLGTTRYKVTRVVRNFLRVVLSSHFYLFATLKYYLNIIRPTKKALNNYKKSGKKADYIIFHGIWGAYYYYKSQVGDVSEKCVIVVHAADDSLEQLFDQFPAFKEKKRRAILAQRDYAYEHVDKVVYISKKAYDISKVPIDKKCVIYNGIDDMLYEFNNCNKDVINFVCVGSMSGWKGQEIINQALSLLEKSYLEKLHLYYIGDGTERANLESQVQNLCLDKYITFMGARRDVPELLRDQDVFIMPSKSEGLSIATIEGLRAGLFLLLTDVGGNVEVMGDNGGIVIRRDPNDIKDKICEIIDKHIISKEQKERNRKHFLQYFTTEQFIKGYGNMLQSL